MVATATKPKTRKRYFWTKDSRRYNGKPISKGQIVEPAGVQNDELLFSLNYFKPVGRDVEECRCVRCGAVFVGENYLANHQQMECPEVEVELPEGVRIRGDRVRENTARLYQDDMPGDFYTQEEAERDEENA